MMMSPQLAPPLTTGHSHSPTPVDYNHPAMSSGPVVSVSPAALRPTPGISNLNQTIGPYNRLTVPAPPPPPCNNSDYLLKKHKCVDCNFKSVYRWVVKRHWHSMHKNKISSTLSSQQNSNNSRAKIITAGSTLNDNIDANGKVKFLTWENFLSKDSREGYDVRLIDNFKIMLLGPARSGKTVLSSQFIKYIKDIARKPPQNIIYVYHSWQELYDEPHMQKQVSYFLQDDQHLPGKIDKLTADNKDEGQRSLLVLDDMMYSKNMAYFMQLFTVQARHNDISVLFLCQMMFGGGKLGEALRTISTNSDYLVLHKSGRNADQVGTLLRQISPFNWRTIVRIFVEQIINGSEHAYLMLDMTPSCPNHLRLRSHLFDKPGLVQVYVEN